MSIDVANIERCRSEIADTAQQMLDGHCSYIEGSRKILEKFDCACVNGQREPFISFVAIVSETASIPVGNQLGHWADAAVARFRPDWDEAELWAKEYGEAACRKAISWLDSNPTNFF
ncbi:hypothetical protein [Methylorubrum extorquens]